MPLRNGSGRLLLLDEISELFEELFVVFDDEVPFEELLLLEEPLLLDLFSSFELVDEELVLLVLLV